VKLRSASETRALLGYLEHTAQSVKKPTGFSGMNVSNIVGSKRTDSIKKF
jgi:hypothetical protein